MPVNRQLGAPPKYTGKFAVETNEDGSVTITPGDDERIVGVGVQVKPVAASGNGSTGDDGNGGNGKGGQPVETAKRRGLFGRMRQRMSLRQ
jgi:hypothetical protein